MQVMAQVRAKEANFRKDVNHLNPQYMKMASDANDEQFLHMLQQLHKDGKEQDIMHAAALVSSTAMAVRWNSLQHCRLQDMMLKIMPIGHAREHVVHMHIEEQKGKHANAPVNMSGFLRHDKLLLCASFHTGLLSLYR